MRDLGDDGGGVVVVCEAAALMMLYAGLTGRLTPLGSGDYGTKLSYPAHFDVVVPPLFCCSVFKSSGSTDVLLVYIAAIKVSVLYPY